MFLKRFYIALVAFSSLFISSCSEYQRVLKSTDTEYKLEKALEYYESGKYNKAFPIFDELLTLYRGTAKAQDVYYYFAMTQFQRKEYLLSAYHFKTFYQTFPNHQFAEESAFMVGYCYSLESPRYSLDQANTYKAINELQLFINTHPHSSRLEECNQIIDGLRSKLEKKSFMIAKQYWHTENYKAAVESLNETMSDYPDTPYREEAMYLRLESSYNLAMNSIVSLQAQRLTETRTAYYDFLDRFPDTKYKKQAEKLFEQITEQMDELKSSPNKELKNAKKNS